MFRYLALSWNDSLPAAAARAMRLSLEWQQNADWTSALLRPGFHVFTTGTMPGINEATPLQGGQGIVLGKAFQRGDFGPRAAPSAAFNSADAQAILGSNGRILVQRFWGRYVAFLQSSAGSVQVLRDPTGTLPCFLIRHHGMSLVFSWLEDALRLLTPEYRCAVDWDALKAHLLRGPLGGRETALQGVAQVLPGELLDLDDGRSTQLWSAVDIARTSTPCPAAEATDRLGQATRSCTRSWASCYDSLLLRLSGGVDSSILLSCLAPADTAADVICVNYHSPGSDSDEREYALMTASRVGRDLLLRERDPGFRVERALQTARMPSPLGYVGAMNTRTDADLAASYGAAAMFTGAGGDALFYELPRWWPAADYLHDRGIDAGLLAAALDAARLGKLSVWRTLALAFRERIRPNTAHRPPRKPSPLLALDLTSASTADTRFLHPDLVQGAPLPIGKHMQTVALMHPIGYYDPFEQEAAPELVHPLFSQPLVELCLQLPTYLLTKGGRGRALARNAFAADLPPQITHRRSKGGMEEHINGVLNTNNDLIHSLLLDGELSRRGILQRSNVEEVLSGRPTTLAWSPSQIHGLVAVEAWLTHWRG